MDDTINRSIVALLKCETEHPDLFSDDIILQNESKQKEDADNELNSSIIVYADYYVDLNDLTYAIDIRKNPNDFNINVETDVHLSEEIVVCNISVFPTSSEELQWNDMESNCVILWDRKENKFIDLIELYTNPRLKKVNFH
jgi:hypothetical protein